MSFSPETEKAIAESIARRKAEIFEIERLWTILSKLRDEEVNFEVLDRKIMDWFEITAGRASLGFESIEKVKTSLENAVNKIKEKK